MKNQTTEQSYRPIQIILHWVVVIGVILQIAIHESIVRVVEAVNTGGTPVALDNILAWVHVGVGTTVLVAVLARLYFRQRYGIPSPPPSMSEKQAKIAEVMHRALYTLLLGMVLTGMITWNGIAPLGDVHFFINVALFFLVLGHAAAAIYNQFVRKDGTLNRMLLRRRISS